jgi:ADP-heptose:LPS heptosyltransferase
MAQPTWTMLNGSLPGARIDLATWPHLAGLFRSDPCINRVFPVPIRYGLSQSDLFPLAQIFEKKQYDFLIAFAQIPLTAAACAMPSSPPSIGLKKITSDPTDDFHLSIAYDHVVPYTDGEPVREISFRLVSPWVDAKTGMTSPVIYLDEGVLQGARKWVGGSHLNEGDGFLVIAPGAKWPPKRWPIACWSQLINQIRERRNSPLALIGGREDEHIVSMILKGVRGPRPPVLLTEDIALTSAVIKLADLCICNDSAPMHLSAAVGTECLGLFGPVSPTTSAPTQEGRCHVLYENMYCSPCKLYYSRARCRRGINFCLHSITPDSVFDKIEERI